MKKKNGTAITVVHHVWRATFTGHGRASLERTDMSEMRAALPFSASQFSQVARVFNYMHVPFISKSTFQTYQNNFLLPVIIDACETEQQDMFQQVKDIEGPVTLRGD